MRVHGSVNSPPRDVAQQQEPEAAKSATEAWSLYSDKHRRWLLLVLFLVSTSNYLDRHIIAVLLEPIKQEFDVSDTMLGALSGFSFSLFYVLAGMPVARWADRGNRRTIITLAVTIWSVMTVLCGFAQSFWQLALARVGVGAGESGAVPPSQSLIADYYPRDRRAGALAIFSSAASVGYLMGIGLGGYIAATWGWRSAFIFVGAPGIVLALIVRLSLAEPRLHQEYRFDRTPSERLNDAISLLRGKRSFVYGLSASMLYFFFAYGVVNFIPSYLIRVLNASLAQVSLTYGAVTAAGTLIGTLGGGWAADYLSRRDIRWLAWMPSIAFIIAGPLFMLAFFLESLWIFLLLVLMGFVLLSAAVPAMFAAIHAVCGNRRRATAIAIVFFLATLFGGGFGPLSTGVLSDVLSAIHGPAGLRYSLIAMMTALPLSAFLCYRVGLTMRTELED